MSRSAAENRSAADKRTERILAAAEYQFLTYGTRRTSMDDIAREAELAKGTLYLSFKSKDDLFVALAERIVDRFRVEALAAAAAQADLLNKIVDYLDGAVGAPARLLAATPHAAEILDTKKQVAASIIRKFEEYVLEDVAKLAEMGDGVATMLIEAAHGCKFSGPLEPQNFKQRLRLHICTLLLGVGRSGSTQVCWRFLIDGLKPKK